MSPFLRRKVASGPSAGTSTTSPSAGPSTGANAPGDHLVTLIRKPGCHLCDDAQVVVEKVCADLGVPWEQKDITEDQRLHDQYWEQIPVVLIDGRQHTFWRVDEKRLRSALTA
ncbi:glutaredoxin family protein [Streptomyces thermocoprophilus]